MIIMPDYETLLTKFYAVRHEIEDRGLREKPEKVKEKKRLFDRVEGLRSQVNSICRKQMDVDEFLEMICR